ncbi:MAG TPA: glutathione S-transferase family protein [Motiliproteus sp.]
MGLLINGVWHDRWYDTQASGGTFERESAQFRNWISRNGSSGFKAEADRYHLYISLACPWAHRTLILRHLKGLDQLISVSAVHPLMLDKGWELRDDERFRHPGIPLGDPLYHNRLLHQLYTQARADYSGRVTVPVLWDKQLQTIVSNESADILRMLNREFDHLTGNQRDYYPAALQDCIERLNRFVYPWINNGVYRCGFATTQAAYAQAFRHLFRALDWLEHHLSRHRYLCGTQITEADWRLFTTLVRFDAVYVGHFKCNQRRIVDYPTLSGYLRDLYQQPGIAATVNLAHIKHHYYGSHRSINPTGIVPQGPKLDLDSPHPRNLLTDIQ